jgi:sugar lactone lactonase YvrE
MPRESGLIPGAFRDPDTTVPVLLARDDIPGFNDLFTDDAGHFYTGSMMSNPFSTEGERRMGECFRIDAEGSGEALYGDVSLSNGIGFLPGGRTLAHADTARQHIECRTNKPRFRDCVR